jgi:tetratricopeptide (TPR) repeat protein
LWLNEGLAQYYENTDLNEKEPVLGQPNSFAILFLRQHPLIPLTTLFAVDHNSPYYHREDKGSIFYTESWALTHFLEVADVKNGTQKIPDYALLVANHVDPVTAATRAFGDLNRLQVQLSNYVQAASYSEFRFKKPLEVDETTFKVQPVTAAEADAVRADFLAYNQRETDARSLLDQVLKDDPNNTLAHETMGYLEFRAGNLEQAQKWYEQAVKLDSQSYLANYYFAAIAMNRGEGGEMGSQIEGSLQKAIKLNPSFAPSYDRLAIFYASGGKNLDGARMLELQAVQYDPGNVGFRINEANILVTMQHQGDAITVLQTALKVAKNPAETASVEHALEMVQQMEELRESRPSAIKEQVSTSGNSAESESAPPALQRTAEVVLKGPRRSVSGTIRNVHCTPPAVMDLEVDSGQKSTTLHTTNYFKLQFSALGVTPKPEFDPCKDLEGTHAKVEYVESAEPKINGALAIQLQK